MLYVKGTTNGADITTRFAPASNNASSTFFLSSVSSGDGGYFYNSSNNTSGLFSYGDYTFYVGTGNLSGGGPANPRMIIKQGGNVGIGTTSPSGKLNVEASGNHLHLRANTAAAGKYWNFDVTANNQLYIITDSNNGINITNAGLVGIGTVTNTARLNVGGKLKITDDLIMAQTNGRIDYDNGVSSGALRFFSTSGNTERMRITSSGDLLPGADNAQDLGSTSLRWANIYTTDLHLSNEGKSNDVDNTWGDWTIQEGEEDLFLINNRSGKKYKFLLQKID
jgi:hypothetical protein